jgi:hypothetical protein
MQILAAISKNKNTTHSHRMDMPFEARPNFWSPAGTQSRDGLDRSPTIDDRLGRTDEVLYRVRPVIRCGLHIQRLAENGAGCGICLNRRFSVQESGRVN